MLAALSTLRNEGSESLMGTGTFNIGSIIEATSVVTTTRSFVPIRTPFLGLPSNALLPVINPATTDSPREPTSQTMEVDPSYPIDDRTTPSTVLSHWDRSFTIRTGDLESPPIHTVLTITTTDFQSEPPELPTFVPSVSTPTVINHHSSWPTFLLPILTSSDDALLTTPTTLKTTFIPSGGSQPPSLITQENSTTAELTSTIILPSSKGDPSLSNKHPESGVIIGTIVGILAAVALLLLCCCFLRGCGRKPRQQNLNSDLEVGVELSAHTVGSDHAMETTQPTAIGSAGP
ncbi:hypothetical protein BU23DRAFT_626758 [Bimuria novae-zelandiae CBS 107.79]|uniref:Uncharacterized protein n=1 Tax=Bimuria novae-zelandiae CBS 107.79 TaxID=1447943 RepID=A0A6A5UPF7_9PLEO|nr:hypothetical protein BU23DRAFT_626758 [Bimuria novae-zelandiae CBS 107.79]